jgi:N-acetylglucosamine-6-sulfatase
LTARQLGRIDQAFRKRVQAAQAVDRMLAAIQDTLAATGQAGNTVVVFSSDNGYHLGDYRLTWGKMTAFDTDVRVPLVVTGPGIPAGATNPAIAQNVDLCPTFEELAGVGVPAEVDGEIRRYVDMFEHLRQSAVHGAQARALITRAMDDLASDKTNEP